MENENEFPESLPEYSGFSLLFAILGLVVTFSIFPLISGHVVRMLTNHLRAEEDVEKKLRLEIVEQRQKLKTIHMVDEFAKYARVERQIIKLTEQKKKFDSKRGDLVQKLKIGVTAGFHIVKVVLTLLLMWFYRHTPIIILPESWMAPLGSFISLPSGVSGGIGVVFWLIVCNTSINQLMKVSGTVK
ncbi:guided entry of tail-anchored proteins factor 1-like [Lineus longissimus]|uniref:guided entry of tail-anchored proteins factor 1-like n=1 Tax=Lineus longissimus TaxID=88925 RepID=UPI002B4CD7A8